ncbi:hypothetical protein ABVT39_025044 [Epinephelus coioides]
MLVCNISQQNYTTHKATLLPVARDFYACETRVVSNLRLDIVVAQFVIRRKLFNYLKVLRWDTVFACPLGAKPQANRILSTSKPGATDQAHSKVYPQLSTANGAWHREGNTQSRSRSPGGSRSAQGRQQRSESSSNGGDTVPARHTFPLPTGVYQRRVLNLLIDVRSEVRRIGQGEMASSSAPSARVETMDTMEDFQRQEQRLTDEEAFNALVNSIRLAKIS